MNIADTCRDPAGKRLAARRDADRVAAVRDRVARDVEDLNSVAVVLGVRTLGDRRWAAAWVADVRAPDPWAAALKADLRIVGRMQEEVNAADRKGVARKVEVPGYGVATTVAAKGGAGTIAAARCRVTVKTIKQR